MPLPNDFTGERWLDPLTFQGLVGAAIANGCYERLFRTDGFSKPIDELVQDADIAKLIARL